MVRITLCQ